MVPVVGARFNALTLTRVARLARQWQSAACQLGVGVGVWGQSRTAASNSHGSRPRGKAVSQRRQHQLPTQAASMGLGGKLSIMAA